MSPAPAGVVLLCALALAAQAEPIYLENRHPTAEPEQTAQKSGKAVPLTDAASARAYEVTGFYGYAQQSQDCEGTCAGQGKVAINGGRSGNALCYVLYAEDVVFFGTWSRVVAFQGPTNVCSYQDSEGTWYEDANYGCACVDSSSQVAWKPWADCVTGSAAAARSPAVCRYHKYQDPGAGVDANYWMGWIVSDTCYSSNIDYGPNGEVINGVQGKMGGSNYGLQALCRSGPPVELTLQVTGMGCNELSPDVKKAFKKGTAKFVGRPNNRVYGFTCTPTAKRRKLLQGAAAYVEGHLQLGEATAGTITSRAKEQQSEVKYQVGTEDAKDAQQIVDKVNSDPQGLIASIQKELDKVTPGEPVDLPPSDPGSGPSLCNPNPCKEPRPICVVNPYGKGENGEDEYRCCHYFSFEDGQPPALECRALVGG